MTQTEKRTATPTVTIGMPVHNGQKFIREALDSLLAQTFTDFELIISDNASTDGTEAICREYVARDLRVRYVRQSENRGAIANFQFVLDEAVGEYFMWAAADDVWSLNWVETLLPIAEVYSCLAYGTLQTIDISGRKLKHPANNRRFEYSGHRMIRRVKYYLDIGFRGKANPIYGVFPKEAITPKLFSVLSDCSHGSDMLFLYELLRSHEICASPQTTLYKRIHDNCTGGGAVNPANDKSKFKQRIRRLVSALFKGSLLAEYLSLSGPMEKIVLIFAYPMVVSSAMFWLIWGRINR